jgi:hypothetical protein
LEFLERLSKELNDKKMDIGACRQKRDDGWFSLQWIKAGISKPQLIGRLDCPYDGFPIVGTN